jgi:hypothetical protein
MRRWRSISAWFSWPLVVVCLIPEMAHIFIDFLFDGREEASIPISSQSDQSSDFSSGAYCRFDSFPFSGNR